MDKLVSTDKRLTVAALSIRARIILFSILVTFIPAAGLGWLFYQDNLDMLAENTSHELVTAATATQLAVNQWYQSRIYDLKAFSGSYVLTENLAKHYRSPSQQGEAAAPIIAYFRLLLEQFSNIDGLILFDRSGNPIAASDPSLPMSAWKLATVRELADDKTTDRGALIINGDEDAVAVLIPLHTDSQRVNGWLLSIMPLGEVRALLHQALSHEMSGWLLVADDPEKTMGGPEILATGASDDLQQTLQLNPAQLRQAVHALDTLQVFDGPQMGGVYAVTFQISSQPLYVVQLRSKSEVFANVDRLKNLSLLLGALLMLSTGVMALILARSILRPIDALKAAAEAVSAGNLSVAVRFTRKDELGQVIRVFNDMVASLAASHERLELLSITDGLTGLCNRKRMMQLLEKAIERYKRYQQVFSILMIDIDHFKRINDRYGHQAGDAVLETLGKILQGEIRTIDFAARYGGEEFCLMLDQVGQKEAILTAERIRKKVADWVFTQGGHQFQCTLSIGVSTIMHAEQTELCLLAEADAALYRAKAEGRNRTLSANQTQPTTPPKTPVRKPRKKKQAKPV